MANENAAAKKKSRFPDVYALLFILCIVAMILTWVIPAGAFERVQEGSVNRVVAGTFQYVDGTPQNPWDMLQAIYQGFINGANTIFMIFFCGAAIGMLEETKSLSTAFTVLARKLNGKEALAIAVIMYGLGLGNAAGVFGNLGVAIVPIGIFMARAMGGDNFLGFLIIYFGLMAGFSIGFANPGILGIAQTIAEIPIFSGTTPRIIMCVLNITFLYLVTWFYYKRIKKDPTRSLNYEPGADVSRIVGNSDEFADPTNVKLSKRQGIIVGFFLISVVAVVALTIVNGWSAKQIASWFLGVAVIVGILSGFSMNEIAKKFIKACVPMVSASFVVGIASSIAIILNNGQVMDTVINVLSQPLSSMGPVLGSGFMVIINAVINFFIPSGSGQAAVVMPLMTPMADIAGITRQVAVQAFLVGNGLCDLATPLNGPLMGCLAIAGVSYPKYIKWAIKFFIAQILVAAVVTMGMQAVGWTGL